MTLVQACQHYLEQAGRLASCLDPSTFQVPHALCFGATVGQHLRHCIDHVDSFLDGVSSGRVDYDARHRCGPDETDPRLSSERIGITVKKLNLVLCPPVDESTPLMVKLDCGQEGDPWRQSTVGRELQFLVSHMIHHFAIVGIMCQSQGIGLEENFGVAPSTLKHRASA